MSAIPAEFADRQGRWQLPLITLGGLILALLLLYHETVALMVGIWSASETFAHAFLVPPISLWLVWRARYELAAMQPMPQPAMLLPMLALAGVWLLGDMVSVNVLTQFALVAMVVVTIPLILGLEVTRTILFPVGFLFFCVPVGEFLLPTLMEATADFTVAALHVTGIPVYREGLRFVIPSGQWSVVEACSGLRYLIASFMVGTLFGYLNYRSMKRRWIFAGISLLVPIVANWLRAYMIVMIGHLSNNRLATGVDHLVYGWFFFGFVIMLMFIIGSSWTESDLPVADAKPARGKVPQRNHSPLKVAAAALTILVLPQGLANTMDSQLNVSAPTLALPDQLQGGWTAVQGLGIDWQPRFEGARLTVTRRYMRDGRAVWVYIAYYRQQSYERKLISSRNVLVDSLDVNWNHLRSGSHTLEIAGHPVVLRTAEILAMPRNSIPLGSRLTVWQSYWVHDVLIASDAWAKIEGALERVQGRGDDGAALMLYTEGGTDEGASARLESFAKTNMQVLTTLLRGTRDRR